MQKWETKLILSAVLIFCLGTHRAAAIPITDFISVSGNDWAQVSLFTNISQNDIKVACGIGSGDCSNTLLNGFDMLGWTWASSEQVGAMLGAAPFNIPPFGGSSLSSGTVIEANSLWAPAVFALFTPTLDVNNSKSLQGWVKSSSPRLNRVDDNLGNDFYIGSATGFNGDPRTTVGGWFFRASSTGGPTQANEPTTLSILLLSLLCIGAMRSRVN